jgi:hypothetical protein
MMGAVGTVDGRGRRRWIAVVASAMEVVVAATTVYRYEVPTG